MYLEMNVIAPTTTNTSPFGLLGIPIETIILSLIVTMAVVIVVLKLRRR
jgi:succinate-acetate transporter protein